jgi:secondary thiamine-phosphate synthase enzyme
VKIEHFGEVLRMSRQSTVTARAPLPEASAAAGAFQVVSDTLTVETDARFEILDITDRVRDVVRRLGVTDGLLSLQSLHTTCSVLVNEAQSALHADIRRFLDLVVDRDAEWLHNDPEHSDCDRCNADAHLRALLLGPSVTLQVSGGDIVLGQWQRVLLVELDGPRARTVRLQLMGVA